VDEYIINIAPVLIGSGIPLFIRKDVEVALTLKSIRRFNQFAELHYVRKTEERTWSGHGDEQGDEHGDEQ
jgi:dihydrofolate reductase